MTSFIGETEDDQISQDFDKLVDNEENPLAEKENKGKLAIVLRFYHICYSSRSNQFINVYRFIFQFILFSAILFYFNLIISHIDVSSSGLYRHISCILCICTKTNAYGI